MDSVTIAKLRVVKNLSLWRNPVLIIQEKRATLSLGLDGRIAKYTMPKYFALCSGGKDSMSLVHYLKSRDELEKIVYLDTGIGSKRVLVFLNSVFQDDLIVIKTPANFETLVKKFGFGGHGVHSLWKNYLKGRCIRIFKKQYPGRILASAVRQQESKRRKKTVKRSSIWEGVIIDAPIAKWSNEFRDYYIEKYNIPINPVSKDFGYSGDCFCGCYSKKEEMDLLEMFEPEIAKIIHSLEGSNNSKGNFWGNRDYNGAICKNGCNI